MSVKLQTEQHLEFLSLKEGCTGSSKSTFVKMPHCWKLIHNNSQTCDGTAIFNSASVICLLLQTFWIEIKADKMSGLI